MKENFSLSPCGPYTAVMHQQATEARMDIDAEIVFRVLEVLWMEKRSELKASIMPPLVPAAGRKQNESAKRGPRIDRKFLSQKKNVTICILVKILLP